MLTFAGQISITETAIMGIKAGMFAEGGEKVSGWY
jgi:hypothetical protein